MIVPDDFIIDSSETPPVEHEKEVFLIDFVPDEYNRENIEPELVDSSEEPAKIDMDLPSPEYFPKEEIPGYPLSGFIDWTNSRKDFERDLLSLGLDPDGESKANHHPGWFESGSTRASAFLTSVFVHCWVFFLFTFFPATQVAGTPGYAGNVLSVTIVSEEDLVPQNESPASVDSAGSLPSIAKRSKKPREPHPAEPRKTIEMQERGRHPTGVTMLEKPKLPEKEEESKEREKEVIDEKEDSRGDSLQDSLASMPSTASAERRFIPAAGQGGEAFDSMVLSAIREAIFFPRQAAQERQHGEVVVAFAVNKERSVLSFDIMKSSGFVILDEAAIKIIQKAAKKFPSFPNGLDTDTLHYVIPIVFKEKRG
jgi:periplasmic protein TonB